MKKILLLLTILTGTLFLLPNSAKAGTLNFGFYYAPIAGEQNPNFSKISKTLVGVFADLKRYMDVSAKNVFIKKLPFSPAVVTRGPNTGVDGDAMLDKIWQQKLDYKNADFIFFIVTTPIVLLLTSCDDGFAENIPGKLAIVRYRDQPSQDYFAIVIAHELGHLAGLEHLPYDSCGANNPMLMCPAPMKSLKNIIVGKSFRDAVKNASH